MARRSAEGSKPVSEDSATGTRPDDEGASYTGDVASAMSVASDDLYVGSSVSSSPAEANLLEVLSRMDSRVLPTVRETVKERSTGTLVRLDGKPLAKLGKWGNDYEAGKDWFLDPNWSVRDRDLVLPSVLRRDIPCTEVDSLFWPDVFQTCKGALVDLLAAKPGKDDPWSLRLKWTSHVLELCSMALEATNIQPIFYYGPKWATRKVFMAYYGDGALREGGEYTTGEFLEGMEYGEWEGGQTKESLGGCLPQRFHDWRISLTRTALRDLGSPGLGYFEEEVRRAVSDFGAATSWLSSGDPRVIIPLGGVKFGREGAGLTTLRPLPAMMVGAPYVEGSQTNRALVGDHRPFDTTGWPVQSQGPYSFPLAMLRGQRRFNPRDVSGSLSAVKEYSESFRGWPARRYMEILFRSTHGVEDPLVRGVTWHELKAGFEKSSSEEYPRPERLRINLRVPSSQYWVDLAEVWAEEIVSTDFTEFITDASLFYLINHNTYFLRKIGEQAGVISQEQASEMSDQIRKAKTTLATSPAQAGGALLSIASPLASAVVGQISQIASDEISRVYHFPEVPKPLFRRTPRNAACRNDGSTGLDDAANRILDNINPGDEKIGSGGESKALKYAMGGVAALGLGGLAYYLWRG